jgi:hypothetical protein
MRRPRGSVDSATVVSPLSSYRAQNLSSKEKMIVDRRIGAGTPLVAPVPVT